MAHTLKPKRITSQKKLLEIERKLDWLRAERGMIGGTTKATALEDSQKGVPLQAFIDLELWNVELMLNVFWNPSSARIKSFCTNAGIADAVEVASLAAGHHEIGHWKHCPKSLVTHVDIQDSVAEQLERQGKKSKSLIRHLTNCFEDIVDNTALRREYNERGLSVFYAETGPFTEFFAAYMLIQLELWGDKNDREVLKENFSKLTPEQLKEAEKISKEVIRRWGLFGMSQEQMQLAILDENNWEKMAAVFAACTAPKVKMVKSGSKPKSRQQDGQSQSGSENDEQEQGENGKRGGKDSQGKGEQNEEQDEDGEGKDSQNGEGKGKSEQSEQDEEQDGEGEGSGADVIDDGEEYDQKDAADGSREDDKVVEKPGPGGESFDKELEKEQNQKKVMEERMNRAEGKGKRNGKGMGRAGVPKFMQAEKAIEYIYDIMAPDIPIKVKQVDDGVSLPIIKYTREEFDPEIHDASDVFGVTLGENGNIALGAFRNKFNIDFPFIKDLQGFPNVMWVVDTSSSMFGGFKQHPMLPWPVDCGYHFALLGVFGTQKWLAREQILSYVKLQMVTFSDATVASGWKGFEEGDAIRRAVLSCQRGGTKLDPNVLCPQLDQSEPALVILLSDGSITNWSSASSRIMASLSRHQVFFIKLFNFESDTSRDMRNAGIAVVTVKKDEDLRNLMVDITAKTFDAVRNRQNLWNY